MGCPSIVLIDNDLVFSVCTHDPDTSILTDASSPPIYRVYEEEVGTAILTGSMAKLDDANTTGFYTELVACTTANGFARGKSYTVYIEATVDGNTGGISYGFVVDNKEDYKLASDGLDIISIVPPTGVASNFREMVVQTWRRFFKRATMTTTQIKTYADDGSTVITTQPVNDDGTTQVQGAAT